MQRADSLEKALMLGKIDGKRNRRRQKMRGLGGVTVSIDLRLSKLREMVKSRETRQVCELFVNRVTKSRTHLNYRTTTTSKVQES